MDAKFEKNTGYVLLAAGIIFILISVHSVYMVFTGAMAAPGVVKMESIVINAGNAAGGTNSVELVSGKTASKFMDIMFWYILMFFIAQAGAKISSLGIQLIKEIKVTVKSKDGSATVPAE